VTFIYKTLSNLKQDIYIYSKYLYIYFLGVYNLLELKDYDNFDRLLDNRPQILNSLRSITSSSLLMDTAYQGNRDVFKKLLSRPQDLSLVDEYGQNIFHYLACNQNEDWWFDEMKRFLRGNDDELKKLLNVKKKYDVTPLHAAAFGNRHQAVSWLLRNGADADARDDEGNRPDECERCDEETKKIIREHRQQ